VTVCIPAVSGGTGSVQKSVTGESTSCPMPRLRYAVREGKVAMSLSELERGLIGVDQAEVPHDVVDREQRPVVVQIHDKAHADQPIVLAGAAV